MSREFSGAFAVAEAMHAAAIRLLRIARAEDARAGVAPAQLSALSVLVFQGPKGLGELAEAEQVKPPTMSRMVESLVRQRLVERSTKTTDRRALRLSATPRGRRLLLAGRNRRVRALAKRFGHLTKEELAVVSKAARLLSQI